MNYITCKINSDTAYNLLIERVRFWTSEPTTLALYEAMYENYCDNGYFDGAEFDPSVIVDNDYVNWCSVVSPDDGNYAKIKAVYDAQGLGDCSCEDADGYSYIEAYDEDSGAFLVRY